MKTWKALLIAFFVITVVGLSLGLGLGLGLPKQTSTTPSNSGVSQALRGIIPTHKGKIKLLGSIKIKNGKSKLSALSDLSAPSTSSICIPNLEKSPNFIPMNITSSVAQSIANVFNMSPDCITYEVPNTTGTPAPRVLKPPCLKSPAGTGTGRLVFGTDQVGAGDEYMFITVQMPLSLVSQNINNQIQQVANIIMSTLNNNALMLIELNVNSGFKNLALNFSVCDITQVNAFIIQPNDVININTTPQENTTGYLFAGYDPVINSLQTKCN
jgi:hypothetical protein